MAISLAQRDIENILSIGEAAMACDNLTELQSKTLEQFQNAIGAESSIYFDVSGDDSRRPFVSELSFGVPQNAPKLWCEHYQNRDPFVKKLIDNVYNGAENTVVSSEVVKHNDYINSEFYYDFLRPQSVYHVMVIAMVKDHRPIGLVGLHRPRPSSAFTEKEIAKANMLAPFYSAAVEKVKLNDSVNKNQFAIGALVTELPYEDVTVLDKDLHPVFMNEYFCQELDIPVITSQTNNTIKEFLPADILKCCENWKSIFNSQHLSSIPEKLHFNSRKNGKQISGHVRAYRNEDKEIIFLIHLGDERQNLISHEQCKQYGLTQREIKVAELVSTGMTNPEIAEKLFISIRTVQNHLRSMYAKVDVHNRTSLVSRLVKA